MTQFFNLFFRKFSLFLIAQISVFSFAQNKQIDSLKVVVKNLKEDTLKVNTLNNLGKQLWQIGNYDESLLLSNVSLKLSQKLNFQKGVAAALGNIGIAYRNKGDFTKALDNYFKAIKIDEKLNDQSGLARRYNNIGLVYHDLKEEEKALKYYFKALKIDEEQGNEKGRAIRLGNIGSVYDSQKDFVRALQNYLMAMKIDEELGNKMGIAKHYGNIGGIYATQGDSALASGNSVLTKSKYAKAMEYFVHAIKMYEEIGDKSGMATYFGNIGQLNSILGKYREAEIFIKKALTLSISISALSLIKEHEEFLSNLYVKWNKHALALAHYKKFIAVRDSIFNEENTKKQVRAEMNFDFEKKEAASKLEQEKREAVVAADSRKQKVIIWSVSGILLLVFAFAIFAYRSYLQKQRANIAITKQKQIIEEKQKEILDSIYYARRIQRSLLPNEKYIEKNLQRIKNRE